MKNNLFYKVFASIIVMIFVLGTIITPSVFAEDSTYTITIKNPESGHKYEAYQIFTGTLYEEKEGEHEREELQDRKLVLSNIDWGDGVTNTGTIVSELKSDLILKDHFTQNDSEYTPRQIAVVLESFGEDSEELKAFAELISKHLSTTKKESTEVTGTTEEKTYTIQVDKPGYYFIKDADNSLKEPDYNAYTRYMFKVVSNIEVEPKSEKPTVDKSFSESDPNEDVADYAINEKFDNYLTATLKENKEYSEYEKYKLIFEDTMDAGITFDNIESVNIKEAKKSDNTPIEPIVLTKGTEDINYDETINGQKLTITINDLVKILAQEEINADISKGLKVVVKYKAHLNENANISKPDSETNQPNVNTVKLQYSNDPNLNKDTSMGTTLADKVFVFTYEVDNTKYSRYATQEEKDKKPLSGAGFKLYKEGGETEIKLKKDATTTTYYPAKSDDDTDIVEMMYSEAETGKFDIKGLDAGKYVLKEEKTPDGYNTVDPIEIVIETTLTEDGSGDSATVTFNGTTNNMKNNIINVHGSKLPSTGSIALIVITGVAIVLGISGIILSKNKKKE